MYSDNNPYVTQYAEEIREYTLADLTDELSRLGLMFVAAQQEIHKRLDQCKPMQFPKAAKLLRKTQPKL